MRLLNFRINTNKLEVGGQVFDLHNHFKLQGYAYDTGNRVFELKLRGRTYHCGTPVETHVTTDLRFTFRNVIRLHVKDLPFDQTNVCLLTMGHVSGMAVPPRMVERLEEESAESEGEPPLERSTCLYINFIWGVDILISAETVEATFQQSAAPAGGPYRTGAEAGAADVPTTGKGAG
jgi:hypothetical protein